MKILGMRISRYLEWFRLLRDERRQIGTWTIVRSMWDACRGRGIVTRTTWRARMRACHQCPVYDRKRHACRAWFEGTPLGCGCWMPLKSLMRGPQCWGRANSPDGGYGHRE